MTALFSFDSTQILDRVTSPDNVPGTSSSWQEAAVEHAYWQMGLLGNYHDYLDDVVNDETALKYSAVWACVRWISQTIASLGWHIFEGRGRSRTQVGLDDDTAWLLDMQPNPEMTALEWRQVMLKDALTCGNGYSEIERDGYGRVRWLWPIAAERVTPARTASGRLVYEVSNRQGMKDTVLAPEQVFHLKGLGPDGIVGYSVIEMARKTIQMGLSEERFGYNFFRRGPTPGGVLKVPTKQTNDQQKELRKQFERLYGGEKNSGRVVVLSGGVEFNQLSLPNRDAQFLESRQFSVLEICRWYGVPPHKVFELSKATFSNIEHQSIEAVQDCLLPWARRLESEADVKLFGRQQRGNRFTRLNLRSLLRGDMLSQTDALTKQVINGIATPNEAREYLDLNPDPDGDTLMIQGAMVPLEVQIETGGQAAAGKPAAPSPAPAPSQNGTGAGADPTQADPEDLLRVFGPLLRNVYDRLLNMEADKAQRAANKDQLAKWCETFYDEKSARHVAGQIEPVISAFLFAARRDLESENILLELAADHNTASQRALIEDGIEAAKSWKDESGARASEQALRHLREIFLHTGVNGHAHTK